MNMVSPAFPRSMVPRQWSPALVGEWIVEAMDTSKLLPGHKPAGHRIFWPDIARRRDVDYGDPMKHTDDGDTMFNASREAITRHDEVQRWFGFDNLTETDRKIIKLWALRRPDRWIGRKLALPDENGKLRSIDHRKVKRMRESALRGIALRLTLEGNLAA